MNVSRETKEKLVQYSALLGKWNKSINLIAPSTVPDIWHRHIEDSLQLIPLLPTESSDIIDIGSGAGLPAIIISLASQHNVTMVDSDKKKALFLKEARRILNAEYTVICNRIEKIEQRAYDIITSRACADLDKLLTLSEPFLKEKSYCLFHKGRNYSKEVDDAEKKWSFAMEIIPSKTDNEAAILKLTNIQRRT